MDKSGRRGNVFAVGYGIVMLLMFIFSWGLLPLFNSFTPVWGMPLFFFMTVFAIPAVCIVATLIYSCYMLRHFTGKED